jgi:very-short-patch-repair endonuclease
LSGENFPSSFAPLFVGEVGSRSDPGEEQGSAWPRSQDNRIRNRQIDGHKFVRQMPIENYICDFVCREGMLVIEVDGGQHNESASDVTRDRRLNEAGYRVLRFWNNDVLGNLEGVLTAIQAELASLNKELPSS